MLGMKTLRIALASLLIAFTSVFAISSATASEIKATNVTVSWDDNSLYEPPAAATGNCTQYSFNVTITNRDRVLLAYINIKNKFGDILGSAVLSRLDTGQKTVQLCPGKDLTGSKVELEVLGSGGGPSEIIAKAITFIPRTSVTPAPAPAPAPTVTVTRTPAPAPTVTVTATPAPAPTVTVTATPAPAPTVTVTATPAPAPTVTVTATPAPIYIENPADQTLTNLVTQLNSEVKVLKAKVKKICAAKPKPKGC
jgi:hypothetical protein